MRSNALNLDLGHENLFVCNKRMPTKIYGKLELLLKMHWIVLIYFKLFTDKLSKTANKGSRYEATKGHSNIWP